jgi:hypothetical protein
MSKAKSDTNKHRDNLEGDIKEAVEADKDIRDTVRCITLKALSEGKLDLNELSQIALCVIKGAGLGASDGQTHQLTKAVAGLEDALCSAVEASKLAVEEASSHVNTFSKQDLQRTINDLSELEAMYLETLKDVAKEANEANEAVSVTLNDLARHGRVSGTAVGQKVTEVSTLLNQQLTERLSDTVAAGVDSAAKVTRNLAYAAAGFLDAFAQKLDEKSTSNSNSNKSQ